MSASTTIHTLTPIVVPSGAPEMDPTTRLLFETLDQRDRALAERDALRDVLRETRVALLRALAVLDGALERAR